MFCDQPPGVLLPLYFSHNKRIESRLAAIPSILRKVESFPFSLWDNRNIDSSLNHEGFVGDNIDNAIRDEFERRSFGKTVPPLGYRFHIEYISFYSPSHPTSGDKTFPISGKCFRGNLCIHIS